MNSCLILNVIGGLAATLFAGAAGKHLHDSRARYMHDDGNNERNKYGLRNKLQRRNVVLVPHQNHPHENGAVIETAPWMLEVRLCASVLAAQ
jgi:hypothetical protein